MTTASKTVPPRNGMGQSSRDRTAGLLQDWLFQLVDLSLLAKQAHWNVVGPGFRPVHLELDELVATLRDASDEVAERIVTLGVPAKGAPASVAEGSSLGPLEAEHTDERQTVAAIADRLEAVVRMGREAQAELADSDPISEDLVISVVRPLEKHLWMLASQVDRFS